MLSEARNAELLADHFQYIASEDVREAYLYLVGAAATDSHFQCYGEMKGVVRDFRYYVAPGHQPYAFIVNRESLLFYFRAPAIRSGLFTLEGLRKAFPGMKVNRAGEWTVRITCLADARRVWDCVNGGIPKLLSAGSAKKVWIADDH